MELLNFKLQIDLYAAKELGIYTPTESGIIYIDYTVSVTDFGYLMQIQDITKQKESEEAEERLKSLMDNNPSLIFMKDEFGKYVYLNKSYEDQFIHSKDWYGKTDFDFWPKESAELFQTNDADVLKSGRIHQFLEDSTDLNGKRHVWLNYKFPFTDSKNKKYVGGIGIDATARIIVEEALKESETQLKTIIENLEEGLVVSDMDGTLTHWNPIAIKMHGFSNIEEGILKFPELNEIFELSTMEGNVLSVDQWPAARILRGEHLKDFEVYIKRINSNWERVFNYGGTLVRNAQDQPLMAVITITDITKRKKAEEALKEALDNSQRLTEELEVSNKELKQQGDELLQVNKSLWQSREDMNRAQEVGQIGSWRLNVPRNVLTWSDENYRIFGVSKGTPMTYEMFLEIVHPDDRQYVDTQWNAGLAGEPYDIEHRIVVGTEIKWVREKAYLEFDDEGIVLGGFGITQDITDRKKLEEELRQAHDHLEEQVEERTVEIRKAYQNIRESEEKYRELFNNINDMITLSEIESNGIPGKYIEVNEVGVKRMGYSREEFLNLSPVDIVAPEYRAEMPKNAVVMAEKGSVNFEIVQITKDGKRIPIEVNGHIINYKGRKAYLTVSRDITERKMAEKL